MPNEIQGMACSPFHAVFGVAEMGRRRAVAVRSVFLWFGAALDVLSVYGCL